MYNYNSITTYSKFLDGCFKAHLLLLVISANLIDRDYFYLHVLSSKQKLIIFILKTHLQFQFIHGEL